MTWKLPTGAATAATKDPEVGEALDQEELEEKLLVPGQSPILGLISRLS